MKFSVNQQDLQQALNYCQGVIEKRSTLPILSNILLDVQNSRLTLTATDLDLIFIHQIQNIEILEEGKTTTTSSIMYDIVRKFSSGKKINLTLNDKNKLHLESEKSVFNLNCISASEFPITDEDFNQNQFIIKSRSTAGVKVFARDSALWGARDFLKRGNWLGLLFDQHSGIQGCHSYFLNRFASITTMPELLAKTSGARVVFSFPKRVGFFQAKLELKELICETADYPFKAHETSRLITSGIYSFTRNPMYLGLSSIQVAFGVYLGSHISIFLIPAFIIYITHKQIIYEEEILKKEFGDEYINYLKSVRRWI